MEQNKDTDFDTSFNENPDAAAEEAGLFSEEEHSRGNEPPNDSAGQELDQGELDSLMDAVSVTSSGQSDEPDFPQFSEAVSEKQAQQKGDIDMLKDVPLNVKIELGRSRLFVEEIIKLVKGSVIELDKLAGDPVDIYVNEQLIGRGEVLVLNDNFCVRITEIITPDQRTERES